MSIRIGMPSVGLFFFDTSGLLVSRPPGSFSQATTPHMLPPHCATRILATPSATRQSPVGSAALAALPAARRITEVRAVSVAFRERCNMSSNLCLLWGLEWGQNDALPVSGTVNVVSG